jgi:hypothetical protein
VLVDTHKPNTVKRDMVELWYITHNTSAFAKWPLIVLLELKDTM